MIIVVFLPKHRYPILRGTPSSFNLEV